jgi:hypothetical protein
VLSCVVLSGGGDGRGRDAGKRGLDWMRLSGRLETEDRGLVVFHG